MADIGSIEIQIQTSHYFEVEVQLHIIPAADRMPPVDDVMPPAEIVPPADRIPPPPGRTRVKNMDICHDHRTVTKQRQAQARELCIEKLRSMGDFWMREHPVRTPPIPPSGRTSVKHMVIFCHDHRAVTKQRQAQAREACIKKCRGLSVAWKGGEVSLLSISLQRLLP